MRYVSKLKHPGTIMHPKLGVVQLGLLSQAELKTLYDSGSKYVGLEPGDPPVELKATVEATPQPKARNPKAKAQSATPEGANEDDKETPE